MLAAVRCLTAPRGTDLTKLDLSWAGSKKALANKVGFLGQLRGVNKERIPAAVFKKVREFTGPPNRPNPEFNADFVESKSMAAKGMCMWVLAICNEADGRGWQPPRPATAPADALEKQYRQEAPASAAASSVQVVVAKEAVVADAVRAAGGKAVEAAALEKAEEPPAALAPAEDAKEADVSKRDQAVADAVRAAGGKNPRIKRAEKGGSEEKPLAATADPVSQSPECRVNINDLNELKAFRAPHTAVVNVLAAVRCLTAPRGTDLTKLDLSWAGSKKALANKVGFLGQLRGVNKERIPAAVFKKVREFTGPPNRPNPEFNADFVESKSMAAKGMCMWVLAICNAQQ